MAPGRVIRATRNGLGSFRLLGYYFGHYRGHAYLVPVGLLFLLIGLLPIPSRCSPIHCREVVDKGSGSSMKLRMLGVMDVRCRSVLPGIPSVFRTPQRPPFKPNSTLPPTLPAPPRQVPQRRRAGTKSRRAPPEATSYVAEGRNAQNPPTDAVGGGRYANTFDLRCHSAGAFDSPLPGNLYVSTNR